MKARFIRTIQLLSRLVTNSRGIDEVFDLVQKSWYYANLDLQMRRWMEGDG